MRALLLATAVLALAACQTTGSSSSGTTTTTASAASFSGVPLPANMDISAPGPDVPASLAAFSGKWGGIWDGVLPSLVVIESVATDGTARGIYAWGALGGTQPGSMRFRTRITGNTFTWGADPKCDFVFKDGKLQGERVRAGAVNTVVMSKVQ